MKMQFALILLVLLVVAHAEDLVAINSFDGRDVLSGVFYANAKGIPVKFMPSQGGNADLFAAKAGSGHDILLIQGTTPVSSFVEQDLKAKNNSVTVYSSADGGATNLDLAVRSGASSFIVVDSAYSDSALSVLPYAKLTHSYVLLSNKDNAAQIKSIVQGKKVIIFGLVDPEVSSALPNAQVIGKGEDKFEDNIIMVNKTMTEFNLTTLIITDGTSLEESMTLGDPPLLLSGKLTPQPTYDFVKSKVREGKLVQVLLIGNDMVVPVYDMREKIKADFQSEGLNKTFGVVVKFAQVLPSAGSSVLVLDTFRMPAYKPNLNITDVVYNTQGSKVMVSVDNIGDGAAYYSLETRIRVNGADFKVFPATDAALIQRGEQLGSEYQVDLSQVPEGNVTALVLVKYGSSKNSLEAFASKEGPLTTISYADTSNVSVQFARYDSTKKTMLVTIRNNGNGQAYVFAKLNLTMAGASTTVSASATRSIDPNALIVEEFPLELSGADVAANRQVSVFIDYGGRQGFLLKHAQYIVPLEEEAAASQLPLLLAAAILLVVVAAVAYFLFFRKKGKK